MKRENLSNDVSGGGHSVYIVLCNSYVYIVKV